MFSPLSLIVFFCLSFILRNLYTLKLSCQLISVKGQFWSNSLSQVFSFCHSGFLVFMSGPAWRPEPSISSCYDGSLWLYLWRNSFVTRSGSSCACFSLIISPTVLKKVNIAKWVTAWREKKKIYLLIKKICFFIYIFYFLLFMFSAYFHILQSKKFRVCFSGIFFTPCHALI